MREQVEDSETMTIHNSECLWHSGQQPQEGGTSGTVSSLKVMILAVMVLYEGGTWACICVLCKDYGQHAADNVWQIHTVPMECRWP